MQFYVIFLVFFLFTGFAYAQVQESQSNEEKLVSNDENSDVDLAIEIDSTLRSDLPVIAAESKTNVYPLKQFLSGVSFENIQCNGDLILVQKYDGSPACVKHQSMLKLAERDWPQKNLVKMQNDKTVHSHTSIESSYIYDSGKTEMKKTPINSIAYKIFEQCGRDDDCTIQKLQDISQTENKTTVLCVWVTGYGVILQG